MGVCSLSSSSRGQQRASFGKQWVFLLRGNAICCLKRLCTLWSVEVCRCFTRTWRSPFRTPTRYFCLQKQLAYINISSLPSRYAQQLNLPQSGKNAGNQLKRKHDVSLTSTSAPSLSKTLVPTTDTMSADEHMKDESVDESVAMTSSESTADESSTTDSAVMVEPRKWWTSDIIEDKGSNHRNCSRSGWDFSSILFPDLGSKENLSGSLASPDPSLLPGALAVGVCDVASWRSKINQRKVKGSPEHRRRGVDNQRQGWHGKKDEEVQSCKNWTEFNDLMARHQHRRQDEQAEHLWNREVTPLHDPSQPLPTRELLDICSVIKPTCLLEGASRLKPAHEWRISFVVYQPDTASEFKKSKPRKPYTHVCVCGFDGPVPELQTVKLLTSQSGDVPVVFAVVDHGDVSFYTMKDFELPTDVFL
uniref:TSEN54 tRNA splicing endonuclease subunit n=1 Tax=Cynoglossus semilaevis TaxID=244447 RepID=A0A3P8X320_CYNSE